VREVTRDGRQVFTAPAAGISGQDTSGERTVGVLEVPTSSDEQRTQFVSVGTDESPQEARTFSTSTTTYATVNSVMGDDGDDGLADYEEGDELDEDI
jgi:hypothetical protein